jgi:hypothetical protein
MRLFICCVCVAIKARLFFVYWERGRGRRYMTEWDKGEEAERRREKAKWMGTAGGLDLAKNSRPPQPLWEGRRSGNTPFLSSPFPQNPPEFVCFK